MPRRPNHDEQISRDDLETSFAKVQSSLRGSVERHTNALKTAAIVGGVIVVVIVFVFGRRSGRRKSTFVEIRRA